MMDILRSFFCARIHHDFSDFPSSQQRLCQVLLDQHFEQHSRQTQRLCQVLLNQRLVLESLKTLQISRLVRHCRQYPSWLPSANKRLRPPKPGMRGRDAARKLTLKVNILQVLTIGSSEIQFIVNHYSQSDGQNKSAKSWTNLQKKTIHIVSSRGKEKIPRTMVSYSERIWQKWAYETSISF